MTRRLTGLVVLLTLLLVPLSWCAEEPLTPAEREKLQKQADDLNEQGATLYQAGKPAEAVRLARQALDIRERLYPVADYPVGHPEFANSLNALGTCLQAMGEYGKALPHYEKALAMRERLYPLEHYKDGHPHLAQSLNNLGSLLQAMGEYGKALPHYEKALAMNERLYPLERYKDGDHHLATSISNLGSLLQAMGEYGKALPYHEKALAMRERLYPSDRYKDGHPQLAGSLNNLGFLLAAIEENGKALAYYEKALAMNERLYPPDRYKDGHPDLARSLNNLGVLLKAMGEYGKALPYHEKALAMRERLYPPERYKDGHPQLATSLSNLGFILKAMGENGKALPYYEKALAMRQRLYPPERYKDGHPELATSLSNLGVLLRVMGEYSKALPCYEKALAMNERLYPLERYKEGHPDLAQSLNNLSALLKAMGQHGKALPYLQKAAQSHTRQAERETAAAPETQALALLRSFQGTHHAYLGSARHVPEEPAADVHAVMWPTKGFVLDLLTRRHQAARADASPDTQARWSQLLKVRQQQNRLAAEPIKDPAARQQRLTELADQQGKLERELAATMPELPRRKQLATLGPKDLIAKLEAGSAFVDVYRHGEWEKGQFAGYRYQVFVLAPGQEVRRIDLGPAQPIDEAILSWRRSIDRIEDSVTPARLKEQVWDKLAAALPPGTKVVYLCPDGNLARLPWAALPGSKPHTILLEETAVVIVPAGKWLLEQVLHPQKADAPGADATALALVAAGAIDYGAPPMGQKAAYPQLTETSRELKRVLEAFNAVEGLQGAAVTPRTLKERLAEARYAHFATHGYFDAAGVSAEQKRLREQLEKWTFDAKGQQGVGVRQHPLGYVGLALAGANDPRSADDGGILTGLALVDLPLENLRLCVLSACETGLGELTAGEGVVGLQRAFHVAGCPNVIGSLWKVDDAATAALMAQFYHELRVNKATPLEALRQAQLTIYRHPDRIPALAGERGRPALDATAKLGSAATETKPDEKPKCTPTKLWAAFVLSGVGK